MIVLALDTSGPSAGVALLRDGQLCYEATVVNRLTHSVNLMPMVEEGLRCAGVTMPEVDLLAAVVGPGSFTGVRIAVAAVQAMAYALDRPCVAVNALEALALGVAESPRVVCPIRDARVQQVYGAAFLHGERLMDDAALKVAEYLRVIEPMGEQFLFVGDGVAPCRQVIVETLGSRASFAPPHLNLLKPGAAALIAGSDRAVHLAPDDLKPLYLRQPQAEREREKQHG